MLKLKFLLPTILFSVSCNSSEKSKPHIVGGSLAGNYEFFVGLYHPDYPGRSFCGGALIAHDIVMTAAHCVEDSTNPLEVAIGVTDNTKPDPLRMRKVKAMNIHPGWNSDTYENDIALLYLDSKAGDETNFRTADLNNSGSFPFVQSFLRVIGHGNITSSGVIEDPLLREVDLPVVDQTVCKTTYSELTDSMLCAGQLFKGGIDSCQGDSGGPLFVPAHTQGIRPLLVGVVSFGRGCAQKVAPGVYTRVSSYTEWVADSIVKYRNPPAITQATLPGLIEQYCYHSSTNIEIFGDANSKASVSDILRFQGELQALPNGSSYETIKSLNNLVEIFRCSFRPGNQATVEVIFSKAPKGANTGKGLRSFVKAGDALYEFEALEKQSLNFDCKSDNPKFSTIKAELWPKDWDLWSIDIGSTSYAGEKVEDAPSKTTEDFTCTAGEYGLSIHSNPTGTFAQIRAIPGEAPVWFMLYIWLETMSAKVVATGQNRGIIEILNDSFDDLYTWKISCDFNFTLRDRWSSTYKSLSKEGRWELLFEYPSNRNGEILNTYSRTFQLELADISMDSLSTRSCEVNGRKLIFSLESF